MLQLTQSEADALIVMTKVRADDRVWDYPDFGGKLSIPLFSENRREEFLLDVYRGRIEIHKGTYQTRARKIILLVRLDFGGAMHRNPDNEEIPCPHLHLYREGFGDKWAIPIPHESFPNIGDAWLTLMDFFRFCNVTVQPVIRRGLFT
jgi:hypothetical protein